MKKKMAVDPLSESRWSKIEGGVFDALDQDALPSMAPRAEATRFSPRMRMVAIGVCAAAVAAAAALMIVPRAQQTGSSGYSFAPSRIVTGTEQSHLSLGESEIDVLHETAVVASGDDTRGVLLVLEKGGVECEVAPRGQRPPFIVQAGDTRVRVVGTKFRVERTLAGAAEVSVSHGVVEVTRGGETVRVGAGEHWAAPNAVSTVPVIPSATGAVPAPSMVLVPSSPSATAQHTDPPVSDRQRYEAAAKHERTDPEGAMRTYRALAESGGPWAANALFASGRLALERGKHAEGVRLLELYVKRYPHGPNADDAARLLGK